MLKINPKFAAIAPPLKECEYRILEEDIKARGCVDPVLAWNGTIIDGHNRYRICMENDIPFSVQDISFASENEACCFIIKNQLGRRNLTPFQKCELVIPFEAALKEAAEKRRREAISYCMRTGERLEEGATTRSVLANMAGVSSGNYYKAKKILFEGDEETKRRLRCGEISINHAYMCLGMEAKKDKEPAKSSKDNGSRCVVEASFFDGEGCAEKSVSFLPEIDYEVEALLNRLSSGTVGGEILIRKLSTISDLVKKEMRR